MVHTMTKISRADRAAALERWAHDTDSRSLVERDTSDLKHLANLAEQRASLERDLTAAVAEARRLDRSWSAIGAMLGVSKQAAQRKYAAAVISPAPRLRIGPDEIEGAALREFIRDAISELTEQHQTVVIGYYLKNQTISQLASVLQQTEPRVAAIKAQALATLRDKIDAKQAPPFRGTVTVDNVVSLLDRRAS